MSPSGASLCCSLLCLTNLLSFSSSSSEELNLLFSDICFFWKNTETSRISRTSHRRLLLWKAFRRWAPGSLRLIRLTMSQKHESVSSLTTCSLHLSRLSALITPQKKLCHIYKVTNEKLSPQLCVNLSFNTHHDPSLLSPHTFPPGRRRWRRTPAAVQTHLVLCWWHHRHAGPHRAGQVTGNREGI